MQQNEDPPEENHKNLVEKLLFLASNHNSLRMKENDLIKKGLYVSEIEENIRKSVQISQPRELSSLQSEPSEEGSQENISLSQFISNFEAPIMDFSATFDNKALRMMQKMGYKLGSGLGKNEQGITKSLKIETNLGTRGLGLDLGELNLSSESWDFSQETIVVEEKVQWLNNNGQTLFDHFNNWIIEGVRIEDVASNSSFCNPEVLKNVFKAKNIFDELGIEELNKARARANPFETIRAVFFMNRAALKMANIDAACDFMFTNMELTGHQLINSPIYFADVCAGPGGFTEYILWRKKWFYKGFGMTLKDDHDFKVSNSTCASAAPFQALYGQDETGNVCNPENLNDFCDKVRNETEGKGVHFMMSDGGFSVDGQEELQEILSKNIYLCQCLLALKILRPCGHFVTKTFDVFTPFSVGLLYLMYLCFEKVAILKPNSSRPANSERYLVCSNFKVHPQTNLIREYLWQIAIRFWEIQTLPDRDILEIVPFSVLQRDEEFYQYIVKSNTSIGRRQIVALQKLAHFCKNPNLIEQRQHILREQSLEYWQIPNEKRKPLEVYKVTDTLAQMIMPLENLRVPPRLICNYANLESTISNINHWHYTYLFSLPKLNRTNFYAAVGFSKVYRLQREKWTKVKDLELVKGTLLYGEFVKETSLLDNEETCTRYSLHVIDAICLGKMDLQKYSFEERLKFIHIFCKSMNKESQSRYSVRLRPKVLKPLTYLPQDFRLKGGQDGQLCVTLPKIGYKSVCERHDVNSILLIKTNAAQTFQSTHALRVQIFNTKDDSLTSSITFDELTKMVENLLQ